MPSSYRPAHFDADPVRRARELLGSELRRTLPDGRVLSGRVVETEAYDCPRDPSCTAGRFHAVKSQELAAAPGHFVFWVAYGHPLLQITCRAEGVAASVLIRALEPLEGLDAMLEHRPVVSERNLTSGPAKLVQALAIAPEVFRGRPVNGAGLCLLPGPALPDEQVSVTARVGIAAGRNLPWRFYETGSPWISGGVPSMLL
ncbi:3-methyladenine DNA glycosylase [Deinococcus irradiatisoli]|uniref:Putative 3-methyladenine DNA glycosylase n=1 Tax=Deinococcus irradiatisoli TaxID=2202254 RepID=A0A2Z3JJ94_9DEIO|nr:DNA-3-methyladenine glycosylase [Deinococcus irradiatisoli]AWN23661.1 3-methyladenine DNA glycosylase [Deinococcus irradiatisoli]